LGITHKVVATAEEFQSELRCGIYDAYWISPTAQDLDEQLIKELREAVRRGDALIVDGDHDSRNRSLLPLLGVKQIGKLPQQNYTAILLDGTVLPVGQLATLGQPTRYELITGQSVAVFGSAPAIVLNQYGDGRTALFAFDLAAMLGADPTLSNSLLRQTITSTTNHLASTPGTLTVNDVVALQTDVVNRGTRPVTLELRATIPIGVGVIGSVPDATITPASATGPGSAILRITVPSGQSARWLLKVRPTRPGAQSIPVAIYSVPDTSGAAPKLEKTVTHSLTVQGDEALLTAATAAVDQLRPTRSSDNSAKRRAQDDIRDAKSLIQHGDFDAAIGAWLSASDEVARISSVPSAQKAAALSALALAVEATTDRLCDVAACIRGSLVLDSHQVAAQGTLRWRRVVTNACTVPISGVDVQAWVSGLGSCRNLLNLSDRLNLGSLQTSDRSATWRANASAGQEIELNLTARWQGMTLPLAQDRVQVVPAR
jgi:hypothetical protein